jgi:hypothetical protein
MIFQEYDRNIIWAEENYAIGEKPELLMKRVDVTSAKSIDFYSGDEIYHDEAKEYRKNVSDQSLIDTCAMIASLSIDFSEDVLGWAKHMNVQVNEEDDIVQDVNVLNQVMELCGGGYTKLFVLFHKVLQKPDIMFLHNPGSSLHPTLSRNVLRTLEYFSPKTKFIITDAREFVSIQESYCY